MRPAILIVVCSLMFTSHRVGGEIMYAVGRPTIATTFGIGLESREWTTPPVTTERETLTTREHFDIRTRGWLYHPDLVNFSFAVQPEFEQYEEEWNSGDTAERKATFVGFLLDANVLPYDPYSLNLHATRNRRHATASRAIGNNTTEYSLYRARVLAKHPVLSTTVSLEAKDRESETFLSTRHEDTQRLHVRTRHTTAESRSWLETEYLERDVSAGDIQSSSERVSLRGNNQLVLGYKSQAASHISYTDQSTATYSSKNASASSRVNLTHSDHFLTRYEVKYDERRLRDFETQRSFISAALRHRLYENLTTRLDAELDQQKGTDALLDNRAASADFAYTRPIPVGRIFLDYGHRRRHTDYQRQVAVGRVRDEPHRLVGGIENRVALGHADIDINTVHVSDIDGNPYVLDVDYELERDGDRVFLWRNLLGGIADGETVLVDYDYETDPSVELTRVTHAYGGAVDFWSTLKLYSHRSESDVEVLSGTEPDESVHGSELVGAELRLRFGSAISSTAVEQAEQDAAVVSLEAVRARQLLTVGTWSRTEIEAEDKKTEETVVAEDGTNTLAHTRTKTLLARHRFTADRWSMTDIEAEDRRVEGDITERTELPATIYRLRQTFRFGWSNTVIEAEDISVRGDLVNFPPTRFRRDLTPARQWRIRQSLAFRFSPTLHAGFSANYFERERKDTELRSEGGGFSASANWNLGSRGVFKGRVFRQKTTSHDHSEERLGIDARHEWRYGAWFPSVHYVLSNEEREPSGEKRKDSLLLFEVRRMFW